MKPYISYAIRNTNDGRFGVCYREGGCYSLRATMIYDTYDEAYRIARAYLCGREPEDETRHH